jgi:hypothetical protein
MDSSKEEERSQTWRRTIEKELMKMKLTWRQARDAAKD